MKSIFVQIKALLLIIFWGVILAPELAHANTSIPVPRVKPASPNFSTLLNDTEAQHFRRAVQSADGKQWASFDKHLKKISDNSAKNALHWLQATRDPNVSFKKLDYVITNLSNWPRMTALRNNAERKIYDTPRLVADLEQWFGGVDPVSGEGRVALAKYYYANGRQAEGDKWLKYAWRESKLSRTKQKELFKRYKSRLTPDDHAARADHLIWLGPRYFESARGLLSLMPKEQSALMNARMRVNRNSRGMDAAIKAVPSRSQTDSGLLYERGRWRRRKKDKAYALPMITQINTPPFSDEGKKRIWTERKILAYWAIEQKRYQDAYKLTQNHGFTRGAEFASAEFLAGWLALTKLNNAAKAMEHFTRLHENVTLPVSLSRAAYWQGRAAEKLRRNASPYYLASANHTNTYYGMIAAQKTSPNSAYVILPPEPDASYAERSFESDPRIRAMKMFGEAKSEKHYTSFSFHLDDEFDDPAQLSMLSKMGANMGFMRSSIRAAKQASRLQTMLTESGYPRIPAIDKLSRQFDKPFVYAIARQESEFNSTAVSHAKAYGLMQMINGTAKSTARRHRIPYSRSRMTSDIDYSARLGAHHLNDLLDEFNGSYILAACAYNAGSHRAKKWIKAYGDPRKPNVDTLDWIESIPYSETRNYVQRVMENMQVYRARLAGDSAPNTIAKDLKL